MPVVLAVAFANGVDVLCERILPTSLAGNDGLESSSGLLYRYSRVE